MRSFGTERGVVTVAGMHHRGVVKTVEDLAFKIIHQGREIFGTVGLAGTPRKYARAVPNGEVRCRPRPAPSTGLGRFPGPRIVTPWDRVRVLDIPVLDAPLPVTACEALMAIREPPILLRELHHALVGVLAWLAQRPQMSPGGFSVCIPQRSDGRVG